jgi:K+ transporter
MPSQENSILGSQSDTVMMVDTDLLRAALKDRKPYFHWTPVVAWAVLVPLCVRDLMIRASSTNLIFDAVMFTLSTAANLFTLWTYRRSQRLWIKVMDALASIERRAAEMAKTGLMNGLYHKR